MLGLVLGALLAYTSGEVGELAPMVTADGDQYDDAGKKVKNPPNLGFRFDVGLPDGAGASVVVLPAEWLAVELGGLHNGAGAGLRLGVALIAFPSWRLLRPTLSVDVGAFADGDASFLAPMMATSVQPQLRSTLAHVRYEFASAQAGFEFGFKSVSVVLRGGLSWVEGSAGNSSTQLGATTVSTSGVRLHGLVPSGRLGLMFCF